MIFISYNSCTKDPINFRQIYFVFQGKGNVFTYWLLDEDVAVRQKRISALPISESGGDSVSGSPPRSRRRGSKRLGRVYALGDHHRGSIRRHHEAGQPAAEVNILNIVRDGDSSSVKSGKLSNGPPQGHCSKKTADKAHSKECNCINGYLSLSLRSASDKKKSPPNEHVPLIVVDRPTEQEHLSETDVLLRRSVSEASVGSGDNSVRPQRGSFTSPTSRKNEHGRIRTNSNNL